MGREKGVNHVLSSVPLQEMRSFSPAYYVGILTFMCCLLVLVL